MRYLLLLCISFLYLFADAHILLYHRFNDERYPSTSISTDELRSQFNYLKNNNYTVVPLDKIIEKLETNSTIPDKWVAITIDDGYKSFYTHGYKIFKEFNYPFTMFVYVEATDKKYPDFMSWSELKEIEDLGSLEYHSYSHPSMAKLSEEKLKEDFEKGLEVFEKNLKLKPQYFSYPYGELNKYSQELIKGYNFRAIFNQNNGAINNKSDRFNIDRLAVVGDVNLNYLLKHKFLYAEWEEPTVYPKDGDLKRVAISSIDTNKTKAKLYISGFDWEDVEIENGKIDLNVNKTLQKNRVRVILRVGDKVSTKIITKGEKDGIK